MINARQIRGLLLTLVSIVVLAATTSISLAQIEIAPPERMPPPDRHPVIQRQLSLTDMRVDISIDGPVARTTIRQTLRNDGDFVAEGDYLLPLPKGATVGDFALIDGDNRLDYEVMDADQARQIYQDIVATMRDPGLLEYQDTGMFRVHAFPFPPGESRAIEVSFTQTLSGTTDLLGYHLPLKWAGWSRVYDTSFVLSYEIKSPHELGTISSPSHNLSIRRDSDYRASGSLEERVNDFGSDFTLNIGRRTGDFAAGLWCYPGEGGEDGHFLLSLLAAMPEDDEYVPKDVLFIFDKSGSMSGEKIEQARGGLRFVIDQLKGEDRFELIYYSDYVESLFGGLRTANRANRDEARDFARTLSADGSTDIDSALKLGADTLSPDGRPTYVVFLTDGLPTAGEQNVSNIIDNAKARFNSDVKLFVFGVGYDVNTTLLDSLSYNHHGTATYVEPGEDIEVKVSQFYAKIASPALVDIELKLSGLDEYDLMPRELPDLFHNHEIFITGRYRGTPSRSVGIDLRGEGTGNRTERFEANVESNLSSANHQIPRLWATRKVSYLLDQIRLHGDNEELIGEVDRLAMRYGIVTPYTSYLITEPEMYFDAGRRRGMLDDEMLMAREEESGEGAVQRSKVNQQNQQADAAAAPAPAAGYELGNLSLNVLPSGAKLLGSADVNQRVNYVNNQTFVAQYVDDRSVYQWVDARYNADEQKVIQLTTYGEEYFELLEDYPELGEYLSQAEEVFLVVGDELVLQTVPDELSNTAKDLERLREAIEDEGYV